MTTQKSNKMKSLRYLPILLVAIVAMSFLNKKSSPFSRINTNLLAGNYEVTNGEYGQFLENLKNNNHLDEHKKHSVKEDQWVNKLNTGFNSAMADKYFTHPAYAKYPVVNISLESAKAYCVWKTEVYHNDPKREYKKVLFRLPTETEWQELAAPVLGNSLPWRGTDPYKEDKKGRLFSRTNIKVKNYSDNSYNYIFDGGFYPVHIGDYDPNQNGLYDVIGNVAEMTADGTLKGGSWDNEISECAIDKKQTWTTPDPRAGFRMVMEIIEK